MKTIKLIIILLIYSTAYGQSFKELYYESLKETWEIYEDESYLKSLIDTTITYKLKNGKTVKDNFIDNAKQSAKDRADRFNKLITFFNINFSELDSMAIIVQSSTNHSPPFDFTKKGAIILKDRIYGYSYDLEDEEGVIHEIDYFLNSENKDIALTKTVIGNMIITGNESKIDTLARIESDMLSSTFKDVMPKTRFEIILYDKKSFNKIKSIYVHETLFFAMNRKEE